MSEAKEAPKPEGDVAAVAPKSSKLVPALIGLNSLLLVAVIAFLFVQMKNQGHAPEPAGAAKEEAAEPEEKAAEAAEPAKKEPEAEGKPEKEGEEKGGPKAGAANKLGPLVKISDFVIHLRNPEIDRYARMSFDVEVMADSDKDSLNAHMPRVRDAFITYLSDRTLEELQGAEGLGRTKDALQTKIRDLVPEARVRSLYISDFVVQ
jgi:flagellar FliL protein